MSGRTGAEPQMGLLRALYRAAFLGFERLGVHVTPRHFAFPIPDTSKLDPALWERPSELPGLDLREPQQLELLATLIQDYGAELAKLPRAPGPGAGFYLGNRHFEAVDAEILYGLMRQRRPRRMVEAGSGFSTLLALDAAAANAREGHPCAIEVWDPHAGAAVRSRRGQGLELRPDPVQKAPLQTFTTLGPGDILFIDSSHILEVGSDVRFLFAEVLPRLHAGVLVHVHDVFLPADYPRYWVMERLRFWNEQYLLQALLCGNPSFRVLWGSAVMALRHSRELAQAFPEFKPGDLPASFWFERVIEA